MAWEIEQTPIDGIDYSKVDAIVIGDARYEKVGKESRADMYRRNLGGTQAALRREQQRVRDLERELAGRECRVEGMRFDELMGEWCIELSCGHSVWDRTEPPSYCCECGARVKGGAE